MFTLTDEQKMLGETVAAILADAGTDARGNVTGGAWQGLAEAGFCALPFAEADGGLDCSPADLAVVMGQLGRVPGDLPFLPSVVTASSLLTHLASAPQKAALLPDLLAGKATATLAHAEPGARYWLNHVTTTAISTAGGMRLNGLKSLVVNGAASDWFIVSARTSGDIGDRTGISLFVVPRTAPGLTVVPYLRHDGSGDADLQLADVLVSPEWTLGTPGAAIEPIEAGTDLAIAMTCAEAGAAMDELLQVTVEYLKVRKQFGVPIGTFQALQHKAVDMFVEVEQAKSMVLYALSMLAAEPQTRRFALLATKFQLDACAKLVGETAVQLHGGMGMTMENKAGRLFQRLTRFQVSLGDQNHCMRELLASRHSVLET